MPKPITRYVDPNISWDQARLLEEAYKQTKSVAKARNAAGVGYQKARQHLLTVGLLAAPGSLKIRGMTKEESDAMQDKIAHAHREGMGVTALQREYGVSYETIRKILDAAKTPYRRKLTRKPASVTIPPADDVATWAWIAGVWDVAITMNYGKDTTIYPWLTITAEPSFARAFQKAIGCGGVYTRGEEKKVVWRCTRMADCKTCMERVLPYLKDQQRAVQVLYERGLRQEDA